MIRWEANRSTFSNGGDLGFWGKWPVFEVYWGSRSKDDNKPHYDLSCRLPGIKDHFSPLEQDEAKEKAEQLMQYWLDNGEVKEATP